MRIENCKLRIWTGLPVAWLLAAATSVGTSATPPFHDVKDYGAVGDGTTLATAAIQKAVDACAAEGGGKVVIPPGRYLTGPVFLRSRVQIDVESGAVLLGSTNISDYEAIDGRWEGIERKVYASLFTGAHLEHVSITGRGVIDGRGAVWWDAHRQTSNLRNRMGLKGREPENPPEAPLRWPRPRVINPSQRREQLVEFVRHGLDLRLGGRIGGRWRYKQSGGLFSVRPSSTPARPPAQAAKRPVPAPPQGPVEALAESPRSGLLNNPFNLLALLHLQGGCQGSRANEILLAVLAASLNYLQSRKVTHAINTSYIASTSFH